MKKTNFFSQSEYIGLSLCNVIAVTGPMAAGKNFVCASLEKVGFISVDADEVAHEAIDRASEEIFSTFNEYADARGISLKNDDGSLNRRALGSIVFSDKDLLAKQEAIVYPVITEMINDFIDNHKDKKIIINATVLYKIPEIMDKCQVILFVTAPAITRFVRAKKRDNLPFKQIINRFLNQKNLLEEYRKTGKEIIIVNNR